jgi:hypothetical protein
MTPARNVLAAMLLAAGGFPKSLESTSAEPSTNAHESERFYLGLDEVNLLEGLSAGTNHCSYVHIILTQHSADLLKYSSPPRAAQHSDRC